MQFRSPDRDPGTGDAGRELAHRLASGGSALGLALSEPQIETLLAYLALIEHWNRAYNLTAVHGLEAMVARHLLESLALQPLLEGERVADVGTGAGLPGIPLAIASPALHFTLIDSALKKNRFLKHVVMKLGLGNVRVQRARVQDYRPAAGFDTVVSRAFAPLPRLLAAASHLCGACGSMLAMTAARPDADLRALPAGWSVEQVRRLSIPALEAERHVVVLRRVPERG